MQTTTHLEKMIFDRIKANIDRFEDQFPHDATDLHYTLQDNTNWMTSFWTGNLWLAYAITQDEAYRQAAEKHLSSFTERLDKNPPDHDTGFLYILSALWQYHLTQAQAAHDLTVRAGQHLATRFREKGQYIQAWGPVGAKGEGQRFIVDCMMNIPLLWWTANETGDDRLAEIATQHAYTNKHLIREDFSTAHTFLMNQETGEPIGQRTVQGYADGSMWARGQSWAIFGYAVAYGWTKNEDFLELSQQLADRFLEELTPDYLTLWDLRLPEHELQQKDTSGNAIAAGGLYRLAQHLDGDKKDHYLAASLKLIQAIEDNGYIVHDEAAEGWLKHAIYNMNTEVTIFMPFGDYFYLETKLLQQGLIPDIWSPIS